MATVSIADPAASMATNDHLMATGVASTDTINPKLQFKEDDVER